MARCSICHTRIEGDDEVTRCESCTQEYHASCWTELGGCGTYGCEHAAAAEKPPPPALVGAGWGDNKTCPACSAEIASSLLVCRCGAKFPWADPMSVADYFEWKSEQDELGSSKKLLIAMFLGTLVGVAAPLCGPAAGVYAYRHRERLAGENGTYLAIGYGSAALGAVYCLILLLLAVGL